MNIKKHLSLIGFIAIFLLSWQITNAVVCDCPSGGTYKGPDADIDSISYKDCILTYTGKITKWPSGYTNCIGGVQPPIDRVWINLKRDGNAAGSIPPYCLHKDGVVCSYYAQLDGTDCPRTPSIPDTMPTQSNNTFTYSSKVYLSPGTYQIQVGSADGAETYSDKYGACAKSGTVVPNPGGRAPVLSTITLTVSQAESDKCKDAVPSYPECNNFCGNGKLDTGEECDPSISGTTCCLPTCKKDTNCGGYCGDGNIQIANGEQCEIGKTDCSGYGSNYECNTGTCKCAPKAASCGNNIKEGSEQCDGNGQAQCGSGEVCQNCGCQKQNLNCGNGKIEPGEQCEGSDWGPIKGCSDFDAFTGGTLKCNSNCMFDTSNCTGGMNGTCGNGSINTGEQCDGSAWGPIKDCTNFDSFTGGTLKCGANCLFDTSNCNSNSLCGNSILDLGEQCEGNGQAQCASGQVCVSCKCETKLPNCGNSIIEPGEECEGTNWGPINGCSDFDSFTGGTLKCTSNCAFDTSACTGGTNGVCGNGRIDIGEQCDGNVWGPISGCPDFDNFSGGNLSCGSNCRFDTSRCTSSGGACGNGNIEPGEQCEGTNWGPIRGCLDFDSFSGGTLSCASNCQFDTSKCTGGTNGTCGNGRIDIGEQCDGNVWGPINDCRDFDTFTGGMLSCNSSCRFDTSKCTSSGGACGDGLITSGEQCDGSNWGPISNCSDFDSFTGGALSCGSNCKFDTSKCTGGTSGSCGNGRIDIGEQCEGTNWGPINDCRDFDTFTGGVLKCGADCKFDTSACTGGGLCGNNKIDSNEECDNATANGPWPATCSDTCKNNNISVQSADSANQTCDDTESYVNAVADITNVGGPSPLYYGFELYSGKRDTNNNLVPVVFIGNFSAKTPTYNNGKTSPLRITLPQESGIYCYKAYVQDDADPAKRKLFISAPYAKCFEITCPAGLCNDKIVITSPTNNQSIGLVDNKVFIQWKLNQGTGKHVTKYRWTLSIPGGTPKIGETTFGDVTIDLGMGAQINKSHTFTIQGFIDDKTACANSQAGIDFYPTNCCTDGTCVSVGTKKGWYEFKTSDAVSFTDGQGAPVDYKQELRTLPDLTGLSFTDWFGNKLSDPLDLYSHIRIKMPGPSLQAIGLGGDMSWTYEMQYDKMAGVKYSSDNNIGNRVTLGTLGYNPPVEFGALAGPLTSNSTYFNIVPSVHFASAVCPNGDSENEKCFIAMSSASVGEANIEVKRNELFTYQTLNNDYFQQCTYQPGRESRSFTISGNNNSWPAVFQCSAQCSGNCENVTFNVTDVRVCESLNDPNSCQSADKNSFSYLWKCFVGAPGVFGGPTYQRPLTSTEIPSPGCLVTVMTAKGVFRDDITGNSSKAYCSTDCQRCMGAICNVTGINVTDDGDKCLDKQSITISATIPEGSDGNGCSFKEMEYEVKDESDIVVLTGTVQSKVATITAGPGGSLQYGGKYKISVKAKGTGPIFSAPYDYAGYLPVLAHNPPRAFFEVKQLSPEGDVDLIGSTSGESMYAPFKFLWNIYERNPRTGEYDIPVEGPLLGKKQSVTLNPINQKIILKITDKDGLSCSTSTDIGPDTHPIWGGGDI